MPALFTLASKSFNPISCRQALHICFVTFVVLFTVPHRSLPNLSTGIRWSIDLRWQRPDLPNGFYGLKDCIVLTKKDDTAYKPDWKSWAAVDRGQLQHKKMGDDSRGAMSEYYGDTTDEAFDATVHGPWMDQWEIVNHNKHTAAHDLKPDYKGKA